MTRGIRLNAFDMNCVGHQSPGLWAHPCDRSADYWNIVTSYLDSGARNIGLGGQAAHDDRYDVADEYLEVCHKLWAGSS